MRAPHPPDLGCKSLFWLGETRPAEPGKSIQWIDLSVERRELERAAGELSKQAPSPLNRPCQIRVAKPGLGR
jgi:hypothetical protein